MARYVLLAFDDNKEAEAFIAAVNRNTAERAQVFFATPDAEEIQEFRVHSLSANVFVRGLYMKPTVFCPCGPVNGPFTRGKKFGMWVHAACGKPTKAWATGDHWYSSVGKNLLPVSPEAPEWRGEGIAHHYWDPATKQFRHVETGEPWNGQQQRGRASQ